MRRWWVASVVLAWVLSRVAVVWLLQGRHSWVLGDLRYFETSLAGVGETGLAGTLTEYPLPGLVVIALPWFLASLTGAAYADVVLVLSLAADAAFTALLGLAGRRGSGAVVVWLLAVPFVGATAYARFDLAPSLLAGAALLLLTARPWTAAALATLATGFKLWPGLVLPALAAPRAQRLRVLVVVGAGGALLVGATVWAAGWDRLLSPLAWQAERGLQVESVAATPAMVAWAAGADGYTVAFSPYKAFEIDGPLVGVLTVLSTVASVGVLAVLVAAWYRAWRAGDVLGRDDVTWLALVGVSALVVTGKVLSPQYLLWLLPLAAAGLAVAGSREDVSRLRRWAGVLLLATAATQAVFPELYGGIVQRTAQTPWAVGLLAARNALLVWLLVVALVEVRRRVSAGGPGDRRGPAGMEDIVAQADEVQR